jgi:hypothetical protein
MPPQDLGAQFNKLVQMISNDMKNVGEQIKQIVAKIMQQEQRLAAIERAHAQMRNQPMNGSPEIHGNARVVTGQVMPGPSAHGGEIDASPIWSGDPQAFYKGDDDA